MITHFTVSDLKLLGVARRCAHEMDGNHIPHNDPRRVFYVDAEVKADWAMRGYNPKYIFGLKII